MDKVATREAMGGDIARIMDTSRYNLTLPPAQWKRKARHDSSLPENEGDSESSPIRGKALHKTSSGLFVVEWLTLQNRER